MWGWLEVLIIVVVDKGCVELGTESEMCTHADTFSIKWWCNNCICCINVYVAAHGDFALHSWDCLMIKTQMSRQSEKVICRCQRHKKVLLYFALPLSCLNSARRNETWEKPINFSGALEQGILTNRWWFLLCFLSSLPPLSFPVVLLPDNITFTLLLSHLPPVSPHEFLPYQALTQNTVHFHLPLCLVEIHSIQKFTNTQCWVQGCKFERN